MADSTPGLDDTDQHILSFLEENYGFAGTAEVAEEIGLTTNGAEYRLKKLEKVNEIDSRVVSRDKVWYQEATNTPDTEGYLQFCWRSVLAFFESIPLIPPYSDNSTSKRAQNR